MMDTFSIFKRYQAIRHRLPDAVFPAKTTEIGSLLDIADQVDAFVFDAFGVLNVGETPIPGAAKRLDELRNRGCAIRILSNAASYSHEGATTKFRKLGMQIDSNEIVTSRDAALSNLDPGIWGCIAAPSDALSDIPANTVRLEDNPADYARVDGVLFLSTEVWTAERQALLQASFRTHPRKLIIANADLAAPRDHGFSLEPGYYGHLLVDNGHADIEYFGKPFPKVYDMIEQTLSGISPERIAMCGDTLHTDILGAAARGWQTVLVTQDGMFAGQDTGKFCTESTLIPHWRLKRI